jgi:hypothetical protein
MNWLAGKVGTIEQKPAHALGWLHLLGLPAWDLLSARQLLPQWTYCLSQGLWKGTQ